MHIRREGVGQGRREMEEEQRIVAMIASGDGAFDQGTTRPENPQFNRERKVFASPRTADRKRERSVSRVNSTTGWRRELTLTRRANAEEGDLGPPRSVERGGRRVTG